MSYRVTDRFENWFITSLQTGVNDTTGSFRLNDNLNVSQARLVIDPYDESVREVVKVTSVDGNLVYVERGDDNTQPQYHLEGAIVALNVVAADMNDLYADWSDTKTDLQQQQDDYEVYMQGQQDAFETNMQGQQDAFEASVNTQISDVEALAFLAAHPVGSTYWNETDSTNPGSIYGGTWVALEGVVLGGRSETSGSPFNVAGGTVIGADTHLHGLNAGAAQIGSPSGDASRLGFRTSQNGSLAGSIYNVGGANTTTPTTRSHNTALTGTTDGGSSVQRTLVGYLWKRTA